jgi:imidazolonepropionase-like amidohydrolase
VKFVGVFPEVAVARLTVQHANAVAPLRIVAHENCRIQVHEGVITDAATASPAAITTNQIDAAGLVPSPGLIDCDVHLIADSADEYAVSGMRTTYLGLRAAREQIALVVLSGIAGVDQRLPYAHAA